jgi:branched-chain amino acid transport system ATP-binding protein
VAEPMFSVDHLTASYGALVAVKDLNLSFNDGTRTGIFGHNGSGKSTLLKCLVGAVRSVSGLVRFRGAPVEPNRVHRNVRLGIGFVQQSRNVFPSLSVEKCLHIASLSHAKGDLGSIFEILPLLEERRHQRAGSLSGGEQQMLAVGMALMTKPSALLLDEPSAGLSPVAAKTVLGQLRTINERFGTGIVIVEQNVLNALEIVDRAIVLRSGTVVYDGSSADLKAKQDLWAWF